MNSYIIDGVKIDSVDLKCLVVSRGTKVDKEVYKRFSRNYRLNPNPLTCNCLIFSDGTIAQLSDMSFHLSHLSGILSWDSLKLLKYASQLDTPFTLKVVDGKPALHYNDSFLDYVTFPPHTEFYRQKTNSRLPFTGNAVLQSLDWVAFQCLWPCEYAASGKPCEFCFSGAEYHSLASKGKKLPGTVDPADAAQIISYAIDKLGCGNVQITGGSTFNEQLEADYIAGYLSEIQRQIGITNITGEILLYITPPRNTDVIDKYFTLGADRIACSLELWDGDRAKRVTPGKIDVTTRKRHLDILEYIAGRYGQGKAFSNFIIGLEDFDTLKEGATYLAERGILPAASVWIPMGRPVQGSMKPPEIDYYRRMKELFAGLYKKHGLEPTPSRGLNVCVERDIWNYASSQAS